MNAKIKEQKDFKNDFGVTITSNMGVDEILEAYGRIDKSILDSSTETIMSSAVKTNSSLEAARKMYVTQKSTTDGLRSAGEDAAMGTYMPEVPGSKIQDITLKGTEKVLDNLILSLPSSLISSIKLK